MSQQSQSVTLPMCPKTAGLGLIGAGAVLNLIFPAPIVGRSGFFREAGPVANIPFTTAKVHLVPTLLGATLMIAAYKLARRCIEVMKKNSQNPTPGSQVSSLVTVGPFAHSRNPMYLAVLGISVGGALVFNSAWNLLTTAAFGFYAGLLVIPREENLLTKLFGQAYISYCESVPRWL